MFTLIIWHVSRTNQSLRQREVSCVPRARTEFALVDFFLNVNKTYLFCLFVRWKTNTCRLAFYPSARNKQLDILDSHYVFKVRSQSCLESSSTVHQDSIFMTSFFSLFLVSSYFVAVGEHFLQDWELYAPEIVSMEMTLSGGISQRGLVSKQKAWKISSHNFMPFCHWTSSVTFCLL